MSWFSQFLGGGSHNNPADSAMKYLDQIPGQYTNPSMYNQIESQYKESPGYQFKLRNAMTAGDNAAGAGGMLGSGQHQFLNAETANGIASQDFNDYWQRRMGLNQDMGNVMNSKANYAFTGQAGQNQERQQQIAQLLKLLGVAGGAGLGFAAGGPMGALYGSGAGGGGNFYNFGGSK